jgi:hypothetical protein
MARNLERLRVGAGIRDMGYGAGHAARRELVQRGVRPSRTAVHLTYAVR